MKKIILPLFVIVIGICLYYVFGTNQENYQESVVEKQKARLHFLKNGSQSPVVNATDFIHPGFFDIEKKYRTSAKVIQNPKTQQFAISMSGGKLETYLHYADLTFDLLGEKQKLILFQHLERTNEFLLPFSDLSNGQNSYGAGRYLPIQYNGGDNLILDFNLAENPYCAFNHNFSCPLPPKSNHINLTILAGEKYQLE
jgi:uncharacterized protein